jgi:hypothetical protein
LPSSSSACRTRRNSLPRLLLKMRATARNQAMAKKLWKHTWVASMLATL